MTTHQDDLIYAGPSYDTIDAHMARAHYARREAIREGAGGLWKALCRWVARFVAPSLPETRHSGMGPGGMASAG